MAQVNIHHRLTIEQLYPREAFDRDSRLNAEVKRDIMHGLKISSAPDSEGNFALTRASRHVAEQHPEGDVIFVFPTAYQGGETLMQGDNYGGPEEKDGAPRDAQVDATAYDRFISRVIEAARSAEFKPAIGFHEPRLEGFHGG